MTCSKDNRFKTIVSKRPNYKCKPRFCYWEKCQGFCPQHSVNYIDSNLIDCTETFLIIDVSKWNKRHKQFFSSYSYLSEWSSIWKSRLSQFSLFRQSIYFTDFWILFKIEFLKISMLVCLKTPSKKKNKALPFKVFRYSFSEAITIFFNRLKSGFFLVRSLLNFHQ